MYLFKCGNFYIFLADDCDRIIHQWYIEEFIKPFMIKRFISDTYACLDNRGTLSSAKKTQKYMRKMQKKHGNYYVLQCDIKKFFL